MKILSINTKHTKSIKRIAFNVDVAPSKDILNLLSSKKYSEECNVSASLESPCLVISAKGSHPCIYKSDIDTFLNKIKEAKLELSIKKEIEDKETKEMLSNISKSIEISLD